MNGRDYILEKQVQWARSRDIALIGSKGAHGYPSYVPGLEQNLFQPLLDDVRDAFLSGDGRELGAPGGYPGKMQAVHSSSALGVNVFQYWQAISRPPVIAAACGLCKQNSRAPQSLRFEDKYPVNDSFDFHPNIDVVIYNRPRAKIQRLAIECKFSEPYGSHRHSGLKEKYLTECDTLWDDIPNLRELAESICPDDNAFQHLHAAQLIKHILGLKRAVGRDGFRLLYLWYDVLGAEGCLHRDEVEQFSATAKSDGVMFHALTYQELICRMAGKLRAQHEDYIRYLTERYL